VSQREDHVSAKENVMRRTTIAIGIVALVEAAGCTPVTMYSTMSTHTLDTAADQQTDVVWLLESNKGLLRCSNSATGPVCVKPQIVAPGAAPPPAASPAPSAAPRPCPEPAAEDTVPPAPASDPL
jgi:hypothetical protein